MDIIEEIKLWISCLDPKKFKEVMAKEKGKKDLIAASRRIFISFLAYSIPIGLLMILLSLVLGPKAPSFFGLPLTVLAVAYLAACMILAPISFLLIQGVYWVLARLLGGKGEYREQAYLASFFYAGVYLLSILALVPCLGSIVSIALMILLLYLQYLLVIQMHKISNGKAVVVVVAPIIAGIILYIALYIAIMAYFTPVMVSSGPVPVQAN